MNIKEIKSKLKGLLKEKRFIHSCGVAATARQLAIHYQYTDVDKAELAGLIHDCAKNLSLTDMQQTVNQANMQVDSFMYNSKALLHGPVGMILAQKWFAVKDKDILSAIYYHTTGRPNMSLLEKIVFLADYIEPSRDFPGVENIRELSKLSLDKAVLCAYNSTIKHLLDIDAYIYPLTIDGRNNLLEHMTEASNA